MLLTQNESRVLTFIKSFVNTNGFSPTLEETADALGFRSLTSVQRAIVSLEEKGKIKRDKFLKRNIAIVNDERDNTFPIPLVGMVACGTPILAIENIDGYIPTDKQFLSGNPKDFFYLRAAGDSMNNAQIKINDGDLVLVHKQETARNGDYVVALVDDHATIKKLQTGQDFIALVPESSNPEHKPIILREDFSIQGRVIRAFQM